jgi:D-arabinose 1-dehydrogenase-like Zn-dependent alcohol dehydrogenase
MPAPRTGEVLVKIAAAAINPSDVKNVQGRMSQTKPPRVPGRDFAGRVVSEDSPWRGKSVFGTGGNFGIKRDESHAEFMAVPVEALVEIPPEFSDENAASIGVAFFTAYAAIVRTGAVRSGETVLVTGTTGAVGSALVDARSGTSVVAHLLLGLKRGIHPNMPPKDKTDRRNHTLKPIAADGLQTLAPVFVLKPFILGTVFEPEVR